MPDGTRPRPDLSSDTTEPATLAQPAMPAQPCLAQPAMPAQPCLAQPCLARIVAIDADGHPRVAFAGLMGPPPVARVLGSVPSEQLDAARREARPILIGFLEGRADAPVIMSLASLADLPQAQPEPELDEMQVEVDGVTLADHADLGSPQVIEADHELVLRCGAAAITLRADGTVRITGRDITSWARRRHRIRGGSVAIN